MTVGTEWFEAAADRQRRAFWRHSDDAREVWETLLTAMEPSWLQGAKVTLDRLEGLTEPEQERRGRRRAN